VLFSATYKDLVKQRIGDVVEEAQQIAIKTENLQLDHVRQYYYKCPSKGKVDFLMSVFDYCKTHQTLIFVNTKSFAETLVRIMKKNNFKVSLIFGDMDNEERDLYVQKFRD
jgi:superfamily II DNA/RNA helicase